MHVLVTGGSGNIGREVVRILCGRNHEVYVYDKRPHVNGIKVPAQIGDIIERARLVMLMKTEKFDSVIHLASMLQFGCEVEPAEAISVNVDGTVNVLEAARVCGIGRVVLAGTLATYGTTDARLDEETPLQADAPLYGITKLIGEKVARRYNALYGMDCVCLRFGTVLSGRPVSSPGVAAAVATLFSAATGKDVVVKGVSGTDLRHYVYFKDAALAAVTAAEAPKMPHDLFNIAGEEDCCASFQELADTVRRYAPNMGRIDFEGRSGNRGTMDTSRAKRELGFRPSYTLDQAVAEIVREILSH